jgi:hypothetical protein
MVGAAAAALPPAPADLPLDDPLARPAEAVEEHLAAALDPAPAPPPPAAPSKVLNGLANCGTEDAARGRW